MLSSFGEGQTFFEGDLSEDIVAILRQFMSGGLPVRRKGACRGAGFRKKGCRRWNRNF